MGEVSEHSVLQLMAKEQSKGEKRNDEREGGGECGVKDTTLAPGAEQRRSRGLCWPLVVLFLHVSTHLMEASGDAHRGCGQGDPRVSPRHVSPGVVRKAGAVRLMESGFMENPPLRVATAPSIAPRLYSEAHLNLSKFTSPWDSCCSSWSQVPLQSISLSSLPPALAGRRPGFPFLLQCCSHLL